MSRRYRFIAAFFVGMLLVGLPVASSFAAPIAVAERTAAVDRVTTITFKIPGSTEDATSQAMVIVPQTYNAASARSQQADTANRHTSSMRYPVLYLLHGYSGNFRDWFGNTNKSRTSLADLADRYGIIIVLPDGKFSSWYLDAPADVPEAADWQWETVITKCLIPEIDKRYRTWAAAEGRGITGLSMGGHGAIYLAARHPELFAACSSMSGVMDLTKWAGKFDLPKRLGPFDQNRERWVEHSAGTQANNFAGRKVGIFLDCGINDGMFAENRALHEKLIKLGIPHDYAERPGAHSWEYWINALPYHMQFVSDRLKPAGAAK